MTGLVAGLTAAGSTTTTTTTPQVLTHSQADVIGWGLEVVVLASLICTVVWPVWHHRDVRRGLGRWRFWDFFAIIPPFSLFWVLNRLANRKNMKTRLAGVRAAKAQADAQRDALAQRAARAAKDPLRRADLAYADFLPIGTNNTVNSGSELLGAKSHLLVVGPTGCGKTVSVLAPLGFRWVRAPMLVISTKTDLAGMLAVPRSQLQPVWGWDPTGRTGMASVPGVTAVSWDPVGELTHPDDAIFLADQMIRASGVGAGDNGTYWAASGSVLLSALLWAARLAGQGTGWVLDQAYLGADAWAELLPALTPYPALHAPLAGLVTSAAGDGGRRVDSTAGTVQAALASYRLSALRTTSLPRFTLDQWAAEGGCLFVACPMDQAHTLGPVVVALVSAAIAAERRRRNGDALVMIDELPNVAPLPDLAGWLTELRSWGVTIVGAAQAWGQLAKWGATQHAVEQAWPWLALFNGITDTNLVTEISRAHGDQLVTRDTYSYGSSSSFQGGGGSHSGTSQQIAWEPFTRPENVVGQCGPGQVRLVKGREPLVIVQTQPIGHVARDWATAYNANLKQDATAPGAGRG